MLGMASMAFGTTSRAIAQGASLGLYAGIIFGTYVLVSHHQKRQGSYEDKSSPYQNSSDVYGDEYQEDEGGGGSGSEDGLFNRIQTLEERFHQKTFAFGIKRPGGHLPPVRVNLLEIQF